MRLVQVPIVAHDSPEVATHNLIVPIAYYVIIGRGVSAWYDHLTLLHSEWGRTHLDGLPVLHVGFKEPWSLRGEERMGQWPRMLNFFETIDDGLGLSAIDPDLVTEGSTAADYRTWLRSCVFARSIEDVETNIRARYPYVIDPERQVYAGGRPASPSSIDDEVRGENGEGPLLRIRNGFVGTIETKTGWEGGAKTTQDYLGPQEFERRANIDITGPGATVWANPDCPYRLSVFLRPPDEEPYLKFFYAKKIDICSGVSSARRPAITRSGPIDGYYKKAFLSQDAEPELRRAGDPNNRIVDGNTYIGSPNSDQEVVAVIKSGAVSAQSVQSALTMPDLGSAAKTVWWISNAHFSKQKDLHENLVASETVPGARNQLEISGARAEEVFVPNDEVRLNRLLGWPSPQTMTERALQVAELDRHFNADTNPVFADMRRPDVRIPALRGKLHNLSHHELADVAFTGDGLELTLTLAGRRPIPARDARDAVTRVKENYADALDAFDEVETEHALVYSGDGWLQSIEVDVLVYSSGQDYALEGAPPHMVRLLGPFRLVLDDPTGYPKAYATADGSVRILGGAMVVAGLDRGFNAAHTKHFATLPAEAPAAAGGGINPALVNIRRANGFQYEKLKINSASRWELQHHGGLSSDTACMLEVIRETSTRGYTLAEYRQKLTEHARRLCEKADGHERDILLLDRKHYEEGEGLPGVLAADSDLTDWGRAVVRNWPELHTVREFRELFERRRDGARTEAGHYETDVLDLTDEHFQF